MPKTKATAAGIKAGNKKEKKPAKKIMGKTDKDEKKKIRKKSERLKASKSAPPLKKAKSIVVDIIEDEPIADKAWPEYQENSGSGLASQPAVLLEETDETEETEETDEIKENKDNRLVGLDSSDGQILKTTATVEAKEELDQQKKFFSGLVSEMKDKETGDALAAQENLGEDFDSGAENRNLRRVGIYRRFAIKFILIVLVLAAIVGYFSFSKLTITLALKGETLNDSLLLKVSNPDLALVENSENSSDSSDPRPAVSGTIKLLETEAEKLFVSSGEEFSGQEIVGTVRIINEYSKNQPLVATTRLLSSDNKLFRIKTAVNVPAGGEVEAEIYADKPTVELALSPTKFTIPGLWAGLQDKIYAQSDTAFLYKRVIKKYVKASDLERAAAEINDLLTAGAKLKSGVPDINYSDWLYYSAGPRSVVIDAKAGDEKEEFSARASGEIFAISFYKDEATKFAQAKLKLLTPDDKELVEFDPNKVNYLLDSYDPDSGTATIRASFSGTMILKSDSDIIDRQSLVNLTESQLATYFKNYPEVKDYEFKFSPSFIKRAPSLVDRIEIKIQD